MRNLPCLITICDTYGHCRKWCLTGNNDLHFTGAADCVAIRKQSSSPSGLRPSIAIVSDPTSTTGLLGRSRNRERHKAKRIEKSPLYKRAGEAVGPEPSNVSVKNETHTVKRRNHQEVILKGDRVAVYEKIGSDKWKPIIKSMDGKGNRRSSSVQAGNVKTTKEKNEEDGKLQQAFDLFSSNDRMIN